MAAMIHTGKRRSSVDSLAPGDAGEFTVGRLVSSSVNTVPS